MWDSCEILLFRSVRLRPGMGSQSSWCMPNEDLKNEAMNIQNTPILQLDVGNSAAKFKRVSEAGVTRNGELALTKMCAKKIWVYYGILWYIWVPRK